MCGIAGKYDLKAEVSVQDLKQMSLALEHRGPDGEGFWTSETKNLGLAHRRLAIIDVGPEGNQPMHFLNRYVITYNGEIYNYVDIRNQLLALGYVFKTSSDTEVILASFHHYGNECLQYLDGMFAFAIYDKETKNLFCARDRFGEKPFYYVHNQDHFLFASEMKALWAIGVKKTISELGIYHYLVYDQFPSAVAFYEGIEELTAGHFLEVIYSGQGLGVKKTRYFDIKSMEEIDVDHVDLKSLITSSVLLRSISDVGFCTSMSGGVDSAIVSAICKQEKHDLQSYGIGFPGQVDDETQKQNLLAKHLGINHSMLPTKGEDLWLLLTQVLHHQELPIASMSICAQNRLYQFVRSDGHKVLLEGQGADEVFGGYNYHHKAHIGELFKANKIGAAITQSVLHVWNNKSKLGSKLGTVSKGEIPLKSDFLMAHISAQPSPKSNDFDNGSLQTLLRYSDRNSMMYGLEVRQPFLQAAVVKTGLSLPQTTKFKYGYKKYLLRKSFEGALPGQILWQREKIGFSSPWPTKEMMWDITGETSKADTYFDEINDLALNWQFKKMMLNIIL
ncbi:MAG TPA: asparagine synthase (glutamine-hydrolyzing) [Saprospiraceae bacterium]|nr:asparagine synthase (glutamine-hydrolyzing) [Saprospiraceae bacterium]